MASKSVFCVLVLLVLLPSQLAAEGNFLHGYVSNPNMAMASKSLSDKGFHAMSMLLIDMFFHTLNVSQPLTVFCPPDAAFFSSKYPQPPLTLLQYHALPLKLNSHEDLSFIHHGLKIDTLLPGHPLVVTTLPTDKYESLNKVRVTDWNLYNNGGLIVHGVDNFFDPAFQTLLYPGFDVKKDGILNTEVSKFNWVEELPNKWYLLLAFTVIGLSLLGFAFYCCYEYGHDDDYVPIQNVEDVDV